MTSIDESLELLLEFEKKYCNSSKLANSQMMYWYYKVLGNQEWKKVIPDIDKWVYHYEEFLDQGGDTYLLKQDGSFLGQYF